MLTAVTHDVMDKHTFLNNFFLHRYFATPITMIYYVWDKHHMRAVWLNHIWNDIIGASVKSKNISHFSPFFNQIFRSGTRRKAASLTEIFKKISLNLNFFFRVPWFLSKIHSYQYNLKIVISPLNISGRFFLLCIVNLDL